MRDKARAQGPGSTQALVRMQRVAQRYDMQGSGRGATPMMLDLHACRDVQGLNRLLRGRSSRNLSKIRRAERIGYRVRPILLIPPAIATGHLRPQRLVAYTKLARSGELVHYPDLMGHRDHLADGIMLLMHVHIAQWLLHADTPPARGARAIWYGALEHGGEGLLTWERRAGFAPVRARLQAWRRADARRTPAAVSGHAAA